MQVIILEKKWFIIQVVPAIDKTDTFFCTNGLKTVTSAEGPVLENCQCTIPGKVTLNNYFARLCCVPLYHHPVLLQQLLEFVVHDILGSSMNN